MICQLTSPSPLPLAPATRLSPFLASSEKENQGGFAREEKGLKNRPVLISGQDHNGPSEAGNDPLNSAPLVPVTASLSPRGVFPAFFAGIPSCRL